MRYSWKLIGVLGIAAALTGPATARATAHGSSATLSDFAGSASALRQTAHHEKDKRERRDKDTPWDFTGMLQTQCSTGLVANSGIEGSTR